MFEGHFGPSADQLRVIDKLQSVYYGRPPAIQEADSDVPLLFLDQSSELEPWTPMVPDTIQTGHFRAPGYVLSNFSRACKLSIIINKILNQIYLKRSRLQTLESSTLVLKTVDRDLRQWYQTMPLYLRFSPTAVGKDDATIPSPYTYCIMYAP